MKDFLPIGSVVLLKNATKKLMIIGILQVSTNEDKVYDYLAVPYPEGYIGEDNNFLFSHEDINDVIFRGYSNPERDSFISVMNMMIDKESTLIREGKILFVHFAGNIAYVDGVIRNPFKITEGVQIFGNTFVLLSGQFVGIELDKISTQLVFVHIHPIFPAEDLSLGFF